MLSRAVIAPAVGHHVGPVAVDEVADRTHRQPGDEDGSTYVFSRPHGRFGATDDVQQGGRGKSQAISRKIAGRMLLDFIRSPHQSGAQNACP